MNGAADHAYGKKTTAEVAEAIRNWLWGGGGASRRVVAGDAENRLRTPVQILEGKVAACGELSLLHVAFLRAVGIPARHCYGGWWQGKDGWHFYVEYWDPQLNRWVATDDVPTPPVARVKRGHWPLLAAHATAGWESFGNAYHTGDFGRMIDVSVNVGALNSAELPVLDAAYPPPVFSVWNTFAWRAVGVCKRENGSDILRIVTGDAKSDTSPILLTAVKDGELGWCLTNSKSVGKEIDWQLAKDGICIRWPDLSFSNVNGAHTDRAQ